MEPRTWELGTWNLEPGTWNLEPGTWNLELKPHPPFCVFADATAVWFCRRERRRSVVEVERAGGTGASVVWATIDSCVGENCTIGR